MTEIAKRQSAKAGTVDWYKDTFSGDYFMSSIKSVLPKMITPDRMAKTAMFLIKNNEKLLTCNSMSVLGSMMQCAQLGLDMSPALQQVHLIPYKNECTLIIGYRGMLELMRRSNTMRNFQNEIVFENDYFDFEMGSNFRLSHRFADGVTGDVKFAYAHVHFKDGGEQAKVLSKNQIEKRRKSSKTQFNSPWQTHYEEMCKKSAIRALFNTMPMATEDMRLAAILEDKADAGIQKNAYKLQELGLFKEEMKSYTEEHGDTDPYEDTILDEDTGQLIEPTATEKLKDSLNLDYVRG